MQIGWMSTLADEDDCCSRVQSSGEIGGDCALDETKTGLKNTSEVRFYDLQPLQNN